MLALLDGGCENWSRGTPRPGGFDWDDISCLTWRKASIVESYSRLALVERTFVLAESFSPFSWILYRWGVRELLRTGRRKFFRFPSLCYSCEESKLTFIRIFLETASRASFRFMNWTRPNHSLSSYYHWFFCRSWNRNRLWNLQGQSGCGPQ